MFVVHTSNCQGQNCTRRANYRLGIDTLIANILVFNFMFLIIIRQSDNLCLIVSSPVMERDLRVPTSKGMEGRKDRREGKKGKKWSGKEAQEKEGRGRKRGLPSVSPSSKFTTAAYNSWRLSGSCTDGALYIAAKSTEICPRRS